MSILKNAAGFFYFHHPLSSFAKFRRSRITGTWAAPKSEKPQLYSKLGVK